MDTILMIPTLKADVKGQIFGGAFITNAARGKCIPTLKLVCIGREMDVFVSTRCILTRDLVYI